MSTTSHRRVTDEETRRGRSRSRDRKPRRPWYVRTGKAFLWLLGVGVLSGGALVGVGYAVTDIPAAHDVAQSEATVIYYRDGQKIATLAEQNRMSVDVEQVPEHVRAAVLSAENREFYSEPGISPRGIARAVWSMAMGEQLQGGSTITQQYAKIAFLSQERSVTRKVKEIFISVKLDRRRSKDWILEQYLNTIYFGRGAYGIQTASQAYFHKNVGKLTPAEGAMLAAIINLPEYYSKPENRDSRVERWRYVVDGMVEMGALPPAKAAQLKPPVLRKESSNNAWAGQKGYLLQQTISELKELGYSEDVIYRGGLRVTTTFDRKMMRYAAQAVKQEFPVGWPKDVETGLVAVQPGTGEVVALYGGRSFPKHQYDNAFLGKAMAGSSFKPYVLATALKEDVGLRSMVDGSSPQTFEGGYRVRNAGFRNYGPISLIQATRNSVNTAYVNLALEVGLADVIETAEDVGIPAEDLEPHRGRAGLALGQASLRPVDHAAGFATFAANGVYAEPHVVRKVENADGELEVEAEPETHRAFAADVAADATYAMQQVVQAGTAANAVNLTRPAAGKTGTTDKNKSIWFCGFTPQLSTSVAMFRHDNKPLRGLPGYSEVFGGDIPAQVWNAFMTKAMADEPVKPFPEPAWVGDRTLFATPTPTPTPTPTVTPPVTVTTQPQPMPTVVEPSPWDEWPEEPPGTDPEDDPGWPLGDADSQPRPGESGDNPPRRQNAADPRGGPGG